MDTRLPALGNVRLRFHPDNGFANMYWPTVAELNAGQELEAVTLWDNFEIGAQASETTDAVPIKAKTATARRAGANYGGTLSFWYPGIPGVPANAAALVYAALKSVHTPGYISISVDGEIGEAGQPASNMEYANGDYVTILKTITDEWDDMITGEDPFYYTRNFLKNGGLAVYTVASTTAPVIAVTGTQPAATPGSLGTVNVTVNGRDWTRGSRFVSTAPGNVEVNGNGITRRKVAGAAAITVTLPRTSPAVTGSYSITA